MKTIFLDTNILLHFKNFTEINWITVCEDDKCKIVLAPIVIQELDKHKIGNDEKSKRARRILQQIEEFVENQKKEIRKNVGLTIIIQRPDKNIFKIYHFDPKEQDNQLLASIIEYRQKNKDDQIFLCSFDVGPRLRSQQFGIKIIKLSDNYLLPIKESETEKQLKKLLRENTLLKSRIPKPLLLFDNQEDFIKIKIATTKLDQESFITKKMDNLLKEYPHMIYVDKRGMNSFGALATLNIIPKDQIERHNLDLDLFYSRYRDYLNDLFDYELKNKLSIKIPLVITNTGNTPAEDVDIYCHFPDGFDIIDEDDNEDPPDKPIPPSTPKTLFEGLSSFNMRPFIPEIGRPAMPNLNKPTIKKTNSFDVHFYRKYIKHITVYSLDTLLAVYEDYDNFKNYSIDYTIMAGNIQEPVKGKLNVIYER